VGDANSMDSRLAVRAHLAMAIGLLSALLYALALAMVLAFYRTFPGQEAYANWREVALVSPFFVGVGTLVAARRPAHAMGWVFSLAGLGAVIQWISGQYAVTSLAAAPGALPGGAFAAWASQLTQMAFVGSLVFLLLLFPTGRLPSRRWRFVAWAAAAGVALALTDLAFSPGGLENFPIQNPFGLPGMAEVLDVLGGIGAVTGVLVGVCGALVGLVVRFRRARGAERQQIKWFVYPTVLSVGALIAANGLLPAQMEGSLGSVLWTAAPASISLGAAIAVLRYRLYDIDLLIRRTLVYSLLTAALAFVYFGSVAVLQGLLAAAAPFASLQGPAASGQQSAVAIVASTLVIAALFAPLRRRVQDFIDRRFYRRKYDAARTLAEFSAHARDETDLDRLAARLVGLVSETVQPAHVSLWLASPHSVLHSGRTEGRE
jgi:hypothetical protein